VYAGRDENDYLVVALNAIPITAPSGLDQGALTDQPMTATRDKQKLGSPCAICESARLHYPRLMPSAVSGAAQHSRAHLMQRGLGPCENASCAITSPTGSGTTSPRA